jgi:hypothetical protein
VGEDRTAPRLIWNSSCTSAGVDPRQRWQALQANLTAARRSFENGDRAAALERIDAALALDPDFLAAQALRDRIVSSAELPPVQRPAPLAGPVPPPAAVPIVSQESWLRFEQRARQRRIDRRVEAARSAIRWRRFEEAGIALAEVRELDATHPDLISLRMELDAAQHRRTIRPALGAFPRARGPALAAAAVFAALVLGASWNDEDRPSTSISLDTIVADQAPPALPDSQPAAPIPSETQAPEPQPIEPPPPEPTATTGADRPDVDQRPVLAAALGPRDVSLPIPPSVVPPSAAPAMPAIRSREPQPGAPRVDTPPTPAALPASRPVGSTASISNVASAPVAPPPVARTIAPLATPAIPVRQPERVAALPPPAAAPARLPAPEPTLVRDDQLILQTLQQYRTAYEALDVSRAQAVWPAVNHAALSRAFDGLESQNLTFENCAVDLAGAAARAVCRGSARYVPKIGSREPRVEPRVWNFTLRKAGDDWRIETARTAQ